MKKEAIIAALAIILAAVLFSSCTTQRKATDYFNTHAFQAASYCASAFPVKDSTVYLPGKMVVKHHTDTIPGKTIPCPDHIPEAGKMIYVHCPPSLITHDTITRHDTLRIIRENTARTAALTGQVATISTQLKKAENGRGNWRGRALWTWAAILVVGGGYLSLKSRTALIASIVKKIKGV